MSFRLLSAEYDALGGVRAGGGWIHCPVGRRKWTCVSFCRKFAFVTDISIYCTLLEFRKAISTADELVQAGLLRL